MAVVNLLPELQLGCLESCVAAVPQTHCAECVMQMIHLTIYTISRIFPLLMVLYICTCLLTLLFCLSTLFFSQSVNLSHTHTPTVVSLYFCLLPSSTLCGTSSSAPVLGTQESWISSSTPWSSQHALGGLQGGEACVLVGCLTSSARCWYSQGTPNPQAKRLCQR